MSVNFKLQNGQGSKNTAGVTSSHAVKVSLTQSSGSNFTDDELTRYKILRDFFTNSSGSFAMNVDGSVTNQTFSIRSKVGFIQYITSIRFIFNDGNMDINTSGQLRRFGDAANGPLTNGINMNVNQNGVITNIFPSSIQILSDFFNFVDDFTNFVDGISAGVDLLTLDFRFESPIVLPSGNIDTINIIIKDNLTAINLFNVVARGYQEQV